MLFLVTVLAVSLLALRGGGLGRLLTFGLRETGLEDEGAACVTRVVVVLVTVLVVALLASEGRLCGADALRQFPMIGHARCRVPRLFVAVVDRWSCAQDDADEDKSHHHHGQDTIGFGRSS